jgi:hypothetical protein
MADVVERGDMIAEEHRGGAADGHVVGARFERVELRIGLLERHVGDAILGSAAAGVVEHA